MRINFIFQVNEQFDKIIAEQPEDSYYNWNLPMLPNIGEKIRIIDFLTEQNINYWITNNLPMLEYFIIIDKIWNQDDSWDGEISCDIILSD